MREVFEESLDVLLFLWGDISPDLHCSRYQPRVEATSMAATLGAVTGVPAHLIPGRDLLTVAELRALGYVEP